MSDRISNTSNDQNRRDHRRISVTSHVILTLLVPELTQSAKGIRGVATDLSLGGVRIKSYQITEEVATVLTKGVHWAKVQLELPYITEPVELTARVVWAQFVDDLKKKEIYTALGLAFDKVPPQSKAQLEYVVSRLSGDSVEGIKIQGVRLEKKK